MALIVILACMGVIYSLTTDTPSPVRQLELIAVWCTLGLIGMAVSSDASPTFSLPIAAVVAAPLWYLTLSASQQQARSEARETSNLWRRWQATIGANSGNQSGTKDADYDDASRPKLSTRLSHFGQGEVLEEIEITQIPAAFPFQGAPNNPPEQLPAALRNLELAPVEDPMYKRGRRV